MRASWPALSALVAVLLLLSGCTANLADPVSTATDPVQANPPTGAGAGTIGSHGTPARVDGDVQVRMQGANYIARQNVTLTNDFAGASHATLSLKTVNGGVMANGGGNGGYRLTAMLEGRGNTEQQARDALASLTVVPSDSVQGTTLALGLEVRFNDYTPASPLPPLPVQTGSSGRSASIIAVLPAAPSLSLDAQTSNGAIEVQGLHGSSLDLGTSNGGLGVNGAWERANLRSSNGAISLEGTYNALDAKTSNGAIGGKITVTHTSSQNFDTSNGDIELTYAANTGVSFDATSHTSNAEASVDLPDAHDSHDGRAHARSLNFASAPVQVTIDAGSSNGSVSVTAK